MLSVLGSVTARLHGIARVRVSCVMWTVDKSLLSLSVALSSVSWG